MVDFLTPITATLFPTRRRQRAHLRCLRLAIRGKARRGNWRFAWYARDHVDEPPWYLGWNRRHGFVRVKNRDKPDSLGIYESADRFGKAERRKARRWSITSVEQRVCGHLVRLGTRRTHAELLGTDDTRFPPRASPAMKSARSHCAKEEVGPDNYRDIQCAI